MAARYIVAVADATERATVVKQLAPNVAGLVYQRDNDTLYAIDPDTGNAVPMGAAGYEIRRGQTTTVAASDTIVTGLTTVVSAVANLEDAPVIGCDRAQAVIGDQAGTPAAGSILIKTFKPTASGDATPIAATTFSKKVNWIAVGTI